MALLVDSGITRSVLTFEPVRGRASTAAPRMAKTKAMSKRMVIERFNERGVSEILCFLENEL
jgi:hypothetical protein